jgi:hypothetical protein
MARLVRAIHDLLFCDTTKKDVDGPPEAGHDGGEGSAGGMSKEKMMSAGSQNRI